MTIAPSHPLAAALIAPGAYQALDIGFHQQLQHRLRHGSQEITRTSPAA
jgi:hypothetical protein